MGTVYIYSLSCPETGRVRYIGKANHMSKRLATHISGSRTKKTPVSCWVKSLVQRNLWPVMTLLIESSTENWANDEQRFIAEYRATHADLLNIADGGVGPSQTMAQRQGAGRSAAVARTSTVEAAHEYLIRTEIGKGLSWLRRYAPDGYQRILAEMQPLIKQYPKHFGTWAGL